MTLYMPSVVDEAANGMFESPDELDPAVRKASSEGSKPSSHPLTP
jgi:hypothetical protein